LVACSTHPSDKGLGNSPSFFSTCGWVCLDFASSGFFGQTSHLPLTSIVEVNTQILWGSEPWI